MNNKDQILSGTDHAQVGTGKTTGRSASNFSLSLVWFGAAVSITEILTGTLFAPLGFARALGAIVLGHLIGGLIMLAAAIIGARTGKSAMETVKLSFGRRGGILFAVLNVTQLVGWTAIMIEQGAQAAQTAIQTARIWWVLVIGGLIVVWILVGKKILLRLNTVAIGLLAALTVVLSVVIFGSNGQLTTAGSLGEAMSFGIAVELAATMALSWLPVVSDYTREAKQPIRGSLVSCGVYTLVSIWMYLIGMAAVLYTGQTDVAQIMVAAGMGIIGLLIVVFSTVTTTYLDAYSAGVSANAIHPALKARPVALLTTALGVITVVFFPITNIENFLLYIGSVFTPMIAVLIADFFFLRVDRSATGTDWWNLVVWLAGFGIYRYLIALDLPAGSALPALIITLILALTLGYGRKTWAKQP